MSPRLTNRRTRRAASAIAFLAAIVGIFCAACIKSTHKMQYEAAGPESPIAWASYTCGTNHVIYLLDGRPMRNRHAGWILWSIGKAIFKMTRHWAWPDIRPQQGSTPTPTLVVYVGLKAEIREGSHPELRLVLRNQNGKRLECSGLTGFRTEWLYYFDGLTQDVRGCVVEFIPKGRRTPIGRLKL